MQHSTTPDPAHRLSSGDIADTLLWMVVVASGLANMAASFGGADTWVHLVCGAITVLCAGTLVVRNLRGRR
ncbi:hypothetical protein [Streptomyces sp. GESEQ-4]|uniref:hypothetical protein n=1 Tax=Streptomyces sp. GESEQ-4 TaxID=2812655 RepID=UPI001B341B82|nr:hypothetical protein [Streptomyces sp. GESEQ-4]